MFLSGNCGDMCCMSYSLKCGVTQIFVFFGAEPPPPGRSP